MNSNTTLEEVWVLFMNDRENQAFRDDNFTHEQVFGHLAAEMFTVPEAAE